MFSFAYSFSSERPIGHKIAKDQGCVNSKEEELPRSVGVQYATEDQWRNNLKTELRDGAKAKTTPFCGYDW